MTFPASPRLAIAQALESALESALSTYGTIAEPTRSNTPSKAPTVAVEEADSLFPVQVAHTRHERIQWRVLVKVGGSNRDALHQELTNAKHWLINELHRLFREGIAFSYNGTEYRALYGAELGTATVITNINQDNSGIGAAAADFAWDDSGVLYRIR